MEYGMQGATSFAQGFLGQQEVEEKKEAGQAEAQASGEERKLRMEKMKSGMRKENFKEALQHMIAGDFSGAEEAYGRGGSRRMKKGSAHASKDEEGNTFFNWTDEESGEPISTEMRFALLATGTNPNMLDTPDKKHSRAMEIEALKQKGRATSSTAEIKNMEYIMARLTDDESGEKIDPNTAWKMATGASVSQERLAVSIRGQISKQAKDNMEELTDEQINSRTLSTMEFIKINFDPKRKKKKKGAMAGEGGGAPVGPITKESVRKKWGGGQMDRNK